ncbi:HYR domain-containing protein [Candidatus Nitrosotenuis cloacae]|uniref:HYR domain-containing protein n=1 Tax=Candidatus Nitrosotenuis cloacae TaxID=1603555 RepID=UPI00227E79F3|nr:HYR domain-containing protein [Candidatus Nitrosotenuis cloacae]
MTFTNFAFAYEKENHYWLKIALALNCGFTLDEARLIGIGDFSIDEDPDTQPVRSGSDQSNPKWKWHALPTENPDTDKNAVSKGNQQIKQRQHELYERAMNEKNTPLKLFKFGQYLHYQEDKWSHWGYTTGMGHAVPNITPGMDSPDETHANPESYRYMVFDSMVNLGKLAKSLGKDTACVSDLVPLDTYKSAPEYGKDFPWFSPQEIKRAKDPEKFKKSVDWHLADWGKTALINEVIIVSDDSGDDGVTDSFVSYIAKKTGVSKSDIAKKYDYLHVDIDESGNTKKLPDNLIKSVAPKHSKTSDSKAKIPSTDKVVKNAKLPQAGLDQIKSFYKINTQIQKVATLLYKTNDAEAKTLKGFLSDTKGIYSKTKNPDAQKLAQKIEKQLKDADSDKKNLAKHESQSKQLVQQVAKIATSNGIKKSELDKTVKEAKQKDSPKNPKLKDGKGSQLDHGAIGSGLLSFDETDELARILFDAPTESDKQDQKYIKRAYEHMKKELEVTMDQDAPPESILDDVDTEIRGPDTNELKPSKESKDTNQNQAPPESILDDVDVLGPDARAPKSDQGLKHGEVVPGLGRYGIDWGDTREDMINMANQQYDELQKQLEDQTILFDIQSRLNDLKQKIVIEKPKTESVIQKNPAKLPDAKPAETKPAEPKQTNTKPALTIPKQVTQEATGPSGASVAYSVSAQDREDGAITPTCDHPSGSTFPIGTTSVTCTVKDSHNNSVSGSFTVTVRDTTPPNIPAFQPTEGVRDETGVQVFFTVVANDLVDGEVPATCNYPSGYKFPVGKTVLTCTASDSRGNQSSRSLEITVTITES